MPAILAEMSRSSHSLEVQQAGSDAPRLLGVKLEEVLEAFGDGESGEVVSLKKSKGLEEAAR